MIVVGLDPCTPFRPRPRSKKPAKLPVFVVSYVLTDDRRTLGRRMVYIGRTPRSSFNISLMVAERPHTHGPAGAAACITMGVWAGWLAAQVPAARTLCMPATVWKEILIPGFGAAPKEVFCANIVQMFPNQLCTLNPKVDADQDIIDAHGLCAVAAKIAIAGQDEIDKYAKKWELKL